MTERPPDDDLDRIERALAWRPNAFRRAGAGRGVGETSARWIVSDGRRSAFVKVGAKELTARWIRDEHRNYGAIHGWFMPTALCFDDDGARPVLAIEDLSDSTWPPPWSHANVDAVLEALAAIRSTTPPAYLRGRAMDWGSNWPDVGDDSAEFLGLCLCSAVWLERALPALIDATANAPLVGESLTHFDIRSDNLCIRDARAVVIDWNHASVGNAELDLAAWLPSLHAEGGPAPETILPDAPELAAWVAGFFCSRAGGPPIPEAPHVRPLQLTQARTALPWAARALGLPPPS